MASENLLSPAATHVLSSDLGHRYCIPPADKRPADIWDYPNQQRVRRIEAIAEELACEAFGAATADVRALSGNNAAYVLIQALTRAGDEIASVPAACGGHFATEAICRRESVVRHDIPYVWSEGRIDVPATVALCSNRSIRLLFLDASMQLFPHPVSELREALPPEVTIAYDASHTMGIIAGGQFQQPLGEGADLMQGSTHKSLFGPQKALFAFARDSEVGRRVRETVSPLFVSNSHPHHTAALAVALREILDFGHAYATRVVANARLLARLLHEAGERISFPERGFTDSHQFFWSIGSRAAAESRWSDLEAAGLHLNLVRVPFTGGIYGFRVGLAEVTRRGFETTDISEVAELLLGASGPSGPSVRQRVTSLSARFPGVYFGYDRDGNALLSPTRDDVLV